MPALGGPEWDSALEPSKDEVDGCDFYDRNKYLRCGNAPWDGEC